MLRKLYNIIEHVVKHCFVERRHLNKKKCMFKENQQLLDNIDPVLDFSSATLTTFVFQLVIFPTIQPNVRLKGKYILHITENGF